MGFLRVDEQMGGVSPPLFAVCVMLPVGPVLELSHVTGIWGAAQEVWDALLPLVVPLVSVIPMATLLCCPTTPDCSTLRTTDPSVTPWALLGFGTAWVTLGLPEQRGCPDPREQKGVTQAQPSQVCHRGQPKLCRC